MRAEGWLLDVGFDDGQAVLWVRDPKLGRMRLTEPYSPEFYAEPKGVTAEDLKAMIEEHPGIRSVAVEKRLSTIRRDASATVLKVRTRNPDSFREVTRVLGRLPNVDRLYDSDLLHESKYLSERGLIPFGVVTAEIDDDGAIKTIESTEPGLDAEPPPIRMLSFKADLSEDAATITLLDYFSKPTYTFEGETAQVVRDFLDYWADEDPDIVCAVKAELMEVIRLGRECSDRRFGKLSGAEVRLFGGRVHVEPHSLERLGLAGLVERAIFTRVPLRLCADWAAGKCIDARQCYEARRRGILVPRAADYQPVLSLAKLLEQDKGGLILAPTVGLHENVALLDFESMFPNIIVRRNVSYETAGVGDVEGFISGFTRDALARRLHFKHRRRELARGSAEWVWCEERQTALKENLVVVYGYSGCFANRFGSMDTFMEINRQARLTLTDAMRVANSRGFRVLYGNSDSLFLTRPGVDRPDYEALASEVERATGLPIAVEHVFRHFVLLPQKGGAEVGAVNRYYGMTTEGGFECRGIELRRRDTPPFVSRVQREAIEALLRCDSREEVLTQGRAEAERIVEEAYRRIDAGEVPVGELVVSKALSREVGEYAARSGHVAAAEALRMNHVRAGSGDLVDYLYVDAGNANPFRRVRPAAFGGAKPDAEKYKDMVRQAAGTVLGVLEQTG